MHGPCGSRRHLIEKSYRLKNHYSRCHAPHREQKRHQVIDITFSLHAREGMDYECHTEEAETKQRFSWIVRQRNQGGDRREEPQNAILLEEQVVIEALIVAVARDPFRCEAEIAPDFGED